VQSARFYRKLLLNLHQLLQVFNHITEIMRRFLIAVFAFATALACLGQIVIGNNTYSVDTLFRRQVGRRGWLGSVHHAWRRSASRGSRRGASVASASAVIS